MNRILHCTLVLFILGCARSDIETAQSHAKLTEEIRLDATKENFPVVRNVLVGKNGEMIVPLPQDRAIRFYDSTGKRIASVGRAGDAPGEFQFVTSLGWKGDTLWVDDVRTRRYSYISPRGSFLRTGGLPGAENQPTSPEPFTGYGYVRLAAMYSDGSMLATATRSSTQTRAGHERSTREMLRISPSGSFSPVATLPHSGRWMMEVAGLGRYVPFAAIDLTPVASDGSRFAFLTTEIKSAAGGSYTLSVFRPNGDTVFVKSFEFTGVPISETARDSAINAQIRGSTEGPANVDDLFRQVARERIPAVYPPVQDVLLGLDETIWITLRDSADARVTMVLDGMGNPIGSVSTTTKSTIRQATRSRVWMTEVDSVDLVSVVRYRVTGLER